MSKLYLGLMSGTSADGIDATLIEINESGIQVRGHLDTPHPPALKQWILDLCHPGENEIDRLGTLDQQLGKAFAEAANQLLIQEKLSPADITAIGSHGQTVRHRPAGDHPFTLQIADPNQIAERTGITTVADFRRRDMAVDGQGAPLAPAFHEAAFLSSQEKRLIINIGGIANISDLRDSQLTQGFDTGPGNSLMDGWIERHLGLEYDKDGDWAAGGLVDTPLLKRLMSHAYLSKTPPKSTGREDFHMAWLDDQLAEENRSIPAQDVQATLLEFTCQTLAKHIQQYTPAAEALYVCGGGAHNGQLMTRLEQVCQLPTRSTAELGIPPQQVEGAAFGWLAHRTLEHLQGNCPAVTGARHPVILGGVYFA